MTWTQLHDAGCPSANPDVPVGGEGCTCPVLTQEELQLRAELEGQGDGPEDAATIEKMQAAVDDPGTEEELQRRVESAARQSRLGANVTDYIRVVGPVVPGSIVMVPSDALYGGLYAEGEDPNDEAKEYAAGTLTMMKERFGHDQFVVMAFEPGDTPTIVTGRDELRAIVAALVHEVLS